MKILEEGVTWDAARDAIMQGQFARYHTWEANQPSAAPEFKGKTALGVEKGTGRLLVYTDTGVPIHEWKPTADEFSSKEWQVVELAEAPSQIIRSLPEVSSGPAPAGK